MLKRNPLPFWGVPSVLNRFSEISLESLNYCANRCVFCCVAKPRKKRVMSREDLAIILDRFLDFDGVVNLSNNGDPILLDDLPERVAQIRTAWPKAIINCTSTLAIKREKDFFKRLFANGLSHLLCSCYAFTKEDYEKYQGSKLFNTVVKNVKAISEILGGGGEKFILRDLRGFNNVYPMENYLSNRYKFKGMLADLKMFNIYDGDGVLQMNTNLHDGEQDHWPIPVPCHILWGTKAGRCEVHANLDVVPCCLFPENEYVFGNLRKMTVEEIFNSPAAKYFRDALWNGEISKIPVCNTCQCYDCRTSNREEIDRIVAWEAARLRGEKVVFWGAGQAYRQFAGFFDACHPIGIIVEGKNIPSEIDAIPTVPPEVLLDPQFAKIPVVVFAWPEVSSKILAKIKEKYPRPLKRIWTVPPHY